MQENMKFEQKLTIIVQISKELIKEFGEQRKEQGIIKKHKNNYSQCFRSARNDYTKRRITKLWKFPQKLGNFHKNLEIFTKLGNFH